MNIKIKRVSWDIVVKYRVIPNRHDLEKENIWWSIKDLHFFKIQELVRRNILY